MPLEEHCHVLGRRPVPGSRVGTHIPRLVRKKGYQESRQTYFTLQAYSTRACRATAHTHARGVVYPVQSDTKQKRKEETRGNLAGTSVRRSHTHKAQTVLFCRKRKWFLHPACKQRQAVPSGAASPGMPGSQVCRPGSTHNLDAACSSVCSSSAAYLRGGPAGRKGSGCGVGGVERDLGEFNLVWW